MADSATTVRNVLQIIAVIRDVIVNAEPMNERNYAQAEQYSII